MRLVPRSNRLTWCILATALAASSMAACGGGGGNAAVPRPSTTTAPVRTSVGSRQPPAVAPPGTEGPDLDAVRAALTEVASVTQPTAMAVRPGDDAIYVAEKTGRIRALPGGEPVLDISAQVSRGGEQGLLGLAFSRDGNLLYVDYTDTGGDTRVVEYAFGDGRADPASRRKLLEVDQPFANHNGGEVAFGPDGKLYIGLGDGGGQRDPANRGQDLGDLLGKILRIDPRPGPAPGGKAEPSGGLPYTVPADNPFVDRPGARPEIWAYGLRNPWRFTWDRQTRDLWIGDVGQDDWEEIDFVPAGEQAGANFGWSQMDSMHRMKGDNPPGAVLPIFEYSHDDGSCSIIGGNVYRGSRIPALRGAYIYGDTCSGKVWALAQEGGEVTRQRGLDLGREGPSGPTERGTQGLQISSFGEDAAGELYVLDLNGTLYRLE